MRVTPGLLIGQALKQAAMSMIDKLRETDLMRDSSWLSSRRHGVADFDQHD
jgi:hypothetical protein